MGTLHTGDFGGREVPAKTQHDDGNGGDGMEARIARLETHIKNINGNLVMMWDDIKELRHDISTVRGIIDGNFKWMIGGFVSMAIITVGAIAWFYDAFKELLLPLIGQ